MRGKLYNKKIASDEKKFLSVRQDSKSSFLVFVEIGKRVLKVINNYIFLLKF